MKRKFTGLLLTAFCLVCANVLPVCAEDYEGKEGMQVSFTAGNEMASNFTREDMIDAVSGLQPGDSITFTIDLKNENAETASWYMTNKVLSSLEDSSTTSTTRGGAYTYNLTYWDVKGTPEVLFDSDRLIGEDGDVSERGLNAVSRSLQNYFFLDSLSNGQSGTIVLKIKLDGETQGNAYQNTLADLQMNFAVELAPEPVRVDDTVPGETITRRTTVVRTGDDTNLTPVYIAMAVSGALILLLAFYGVRQRKKEDKEDLAG